VDAWTADFLTHESHALLTRLDRVLPFALSEVMVPAASLSAPAQGAIERHLALGRQEMRRRIGDYRRWLGQRRSQSGGMVEAQRRFTVLRLRFNAILTQLDLFADALSQRSERDNGVWLAGLDVFAADALALPQFYRSPAVVCYLDRGVGAAIRRARTRLPGGGENPVAIIRVPRERMVGSGIASSLVHEVGHQAAALLGLVDSLRAALKERLARAPAAEKAAWTCYERWISEIVADFWSVARVGVTSTMGLIGVVSLPRAFVFRVDLDDPHPFPWIRVKLSAAFGGTLYPHPQWDRLADLWQGFYPTEGLAKDRRALIDALEATMPDFVNFLLSHSPPSLRGTSLGAVMRKEGRQPKQLETDFERWQKVPESLHQARPSHVFAALGQRRSDGRLTPEQESTMVAKLLVQWALRNRLGARTTP